MLPQARFMNSEIYQAVRDGVISARRRPHLARALNSCLHRGEIARLLPGVYTLPSNLDDWDIRIQAVGEYGEDLVVTREAAAALMHHSDRPEIISLASPRQVHAAAGFAVEQRWIHPELINRRSGALVTNPALTVLDLLPERGPELVDDALRTGATTLPQLRNALRLSPRRRGNTYRREILDDSRDVPWSPLERQAHRLLRDAGITGWKTNFRQVVDGAVFYIDIAIPELLLGLEIDGESHHTGSESFHRDRLKDERLSRSGWQMVHFTTRTLPGIALAVSELIALRRRLFGLAG